MNADFPLTRRRRRNVAAPCYSMNYRVAVLVTVVLLQPCCFIVTPTFSFPQQPAVAIWNSRRSPSFSSRRSELSHGRWQVYVNIHSSTKTPEDFKLSDSQLPINRINDLDDDNSDNDEANDSLLMSGSVGEPSLLLSTADLPALVVPATSSPFKKIKIRNTATAKSERVRARQLPRKAVQIYAEYASRLWTDTSYEARLRIARDKASAAIRGVETVIRCGGFSEVSEQTRDELLKACGKAMSELKATRATAAAALPLTKSVTTIASSTAPSPTPATYLSTLQKQQPQQQQTQAQAPAGTVKKTRSVLFGVMMGAVVACWVFSGNYIFTGLFTLMTIIGQLEYYRAVIGTGVYPARRITMVGACSMFLSALFAPELHQICLPLYGLWAMIWFLTMRRQVSTIPEIATTFTGMFYLGYVPSFWVRIRLITAGREPTRLAPIVGPVLKFVNKEAERNLPAFIPMSVHLPITTGAVFIFWAWLCLAFSDVAAYFVGRKFGRTKLGTIAPAAGATSPNKSVEGVLAGCAASAVLGVLGAWIQKWPYWWWAGSIHGMLLGLIGLIGDLTASMLKRDAGLKDFGDLIPDHGGILDRVDSFIWTAPYSWLVCAYVIPALKRLSRTGSVLPL